MNARYRKLLEYRFGAAGAMIERGGTDCRRIEYQSIFEPGARRWGDTGCRPSSRTEFRQDELFLIFGWADRVLMRLKPIHYAALERAYGDAGFRLGNDVWQIVAPLTRRAQFNARQWLGHKKADMGFGNPATRWVAHAIENSDDRLVLVRLDANRLLRRAEEEFESVAKGMDRTAAITRATARRRAA